MTSTWPTGLGRRAVAAALAVMAIAGQARAEPRVIMKDGRVLQGRLAPLTSTADKPKKAAATGAPEPKLIVLCDDGLRRYFLPKNQIQEVREGETGDQSERFLIKHQPVATVGGRVTIVGAILRITPFDEFGRRKLEMATGKGPRVVYQGITEITPTWTKVEGLTLPDAASFIWDQRIATSSIPHALLAKIVAKQIDPQKVDQRLKIVRLYLQMDRYNEARQELTAIIQDFPQHAEQFQRTERELRQRYAGRVLSEIEVRRSAGQHRLAFSMLESFSSEGVAGETLQRVRQILDEYQANFERGKKIVAQIDADLERLSETRLRERFRPIRDEIVAELNLNTLDRMAAFEQAAGDEDLALEDRLALAASGWLLGGNNALRKLPVALSLFTVRNMIRQYLEEPVKLRREEMLAKFPSEEGATVEYAAQLIAHLLPTRETAEQDTKTPGFLELHVDGPEGEPPTTYYAQLPPEYDPHRLYPTIVTLHGGGTTPQQQIDWWAGAQEPNAARLGQATRHGYIVIAPAWGKEQQKTYGYSLPEHAAVLNSLRDACRRFSIDTDRVYLSGHSFGGDAAWDIGLAHPDLWAGVIPIAAAADKYVNLYWKEARYVPLYLVGGEMDGDKPARNATVVDRLLTTSGINATVAEFQGRGHEHFSDEILKIFDWMGRQKREFALKSFTGLSMRPWDNFFWWVELDGFPVKTQVDPADWPPERGALPAATTAKVTENNTINIATGADRVTIWLSPELVDFKRKLSITVDGSRLKIPPFVEPSLGILLEDVRTRAARLHPFWAKVEAPGGRVNVAGR